MKYCITLFSVLFVATSMAQIQSPTSTEGFSLASASTQLPHRKSFWFPGLAADPQLTFRSKNPLLTALAKSETYWMSSMTTQSYNRGKLGTYYYWDAQNNLRESRTFVDIAGKNKRGLKLVFRRR